METDTGAGRIESPGRPHHPVPSGSQGHLFVPAFSPACSLHCGLCGHQVPSPDLSVLGSKGGWSPHDAAEGEVHVPGYTCGGQRITLWNFGSPSTIMWFQGSNSVHSALIGPGK